MLKIVLFTLLALIAALVLITVVRGISLYSKRNSPCGRCGVPLRDHTPKDGVIHCADGGVFADADSEEAVRFRADQQERWVAEGDPRGMYGPDGAAVMALLNGEAPAAETAPDSAQSRGPENPAGKSKIPPPPPPPPSGKSKTPPPPPPKPAGLRGADLSGKNLTGAQLAGMDMRGADLSSSNLTGARLTGTDLSHADLSDANLTGARLDGANLSGADLSGANLTGARLVGATMEGADLDGANLTGARLA